MIQALAAVALRMPGQGELGARVGRWDIASRIGRSAFVQASRIPDGRIEATPLVQHRTTGELR